MALDELKEEDHVEDCGTFSVIVAKEVLEGVPELSLDFVNNARGKGFTISTGARSCGDSCGDSCQ
ncbi:hypothetical protein SAMN02745975_02893 [Geosporobacter subterraneus DSM 17957]|uniref:Uncharacterized protein n=1 Tax=Geosporobacter subterraneus DSM 17957 TaxID=1121919 RepID=A0A1M6M7V6_9FIRM|nr:Fe-S cluster assembly protein HesB [Geosporobacter subterraneus]SHJ79552.1 hypothetical protein SAMN02745975_02893 [Geosporobacter subterraneus DSM 17957]